MPATEGDRGRRGMKEIGERGDRRHREGGGEQDVLAEPCCSSPFYGA